MIYQLKITLKGFKPPIWRRIQVDASTTFARLHDVIQIAMDWDDAHLHEFQCKYTPLSHDLFSASKGASIGDPAYDEGWSPEFFSEWEEILADWLVQENDKCLYTYDFGDDWVHDIVLEKIMQPEENVAYPRCVKARQTAPEEDSMGESFAEKTDATLFKEINERLQPLASILPKESEPELEGTESNEATFDQWTKLFDRILEYKKFQPWKYMYDTDFFAVHDVRTGLTGYCSVLGRAGEVYGLAVYIGDQGASNLNRLFSEEPFDDTYPFEMDSILLSFNDRDDLDKEDYRLIKDLGLRFRGKQEWPMVRRYLPGYHPWYLQETEVLFLTEVLAQAIEIGRRVERDTIRLSDETGRFFARISHLEDGQTIWQDGTMTPGYEQDELETVMAVNELSVQKIRKAKKRGTWTLYFDYLYLSNPVQEEKDQRPYHPRLGLWMDEESGMMLSFEISERSQSTAAFQEKFVELLQQSKSLPRTTYVQRIEAFAMLDVIAEKLGIQVKLVERLPQLDIVKEDMKNMMGNGPPL